MIVYYMDGAKAGTIEQRVEDAPPTLRFAIHEPIGAEWFRTEDYHYVCRIITGDDEDSPIEVYAVHYRRTDPVYATVMMAFLPWKAERMRDVHHVHRIPDQLFARTYNDRVEQVLARATPPPCRSCGASHQDHFFTSQRDGTVLCPACFEQRENKQLAKTPRENTISRGSRHPLDAWMR